MKIRVLVAIIAIVLFWSCSLDTGKSNQEIIEIKIEANNLPKPAKLSEIVEGIRIIKLDNNPESIFQAPDKVFVGKNNIILSTRGQKQEILRFTVEGVFLNKIGKLGNGPEEFNGIKDISVLESDDIIHVTKRMGGDVVSYQLNGDYIGTIPNDMNYSETKFLDEKISAHVGKNKYEVFIRDRKNNESIGFLPITPEARAWFPHFTGDPHSAVLFSAIGRDTLWKVKPDTLLPVISFDFGNAHLSSQEYLSIISSGKPFPPGKLSLFYGAFYSDGYYMVKLTREDKKPDYNYYNVIIREKDSEIWHFAPDSRSDDLLFSFMSNFVGTSYTGEWISMIPADKLIEAIPQIEKNEKFQYGKKFLQKLKSVSLEDNPIIILADLK